MWGFLRPFVEAYDAAVFTLPDYVQPDLRMDVLAYIPPSIDPLSPKNIGIEPHLVDDVVYRLGIDPHRPLLLQVSRFDPWKDPKGGHRHLPRGQGGAARGPARPHRIHGLR